MWSTSKRLAAIGACVTQIVHAGCLQATPFGTMVAEEDRDTTAKNLALLESRGPVSPPFSFVAFADTHDSYDDLERVVADSGERPAVHFWAHAGDMTDRGLLTEFEWTKRELDELDVPYLTAIGNHDALSRGREIYREMFGPYDYAFVYGGVKFVFYNSNSLEFGGLAPQRDWLQAQVSERSGAERLILVTHQPPGGGTARSFYEALAEQYDVTLWIHGHLADYELAPFHGDLVLGTGTFHGGHHSIVTVLEDGVRIERCTFQHCDEVEAADVASGP